MSGLAREALQELKERLQLFYGSRFHGLYLYGSQARGSAHEGSDIDLLVILEEAVRPGEEITRMSLIVSEICLRFDLLISIYPVSAEWLQTRQSPFFENVRKEAVPL